MDPPAKKSRRRPVFQNPTAKTPRRRAVRGGPRKRPLKDAISDLWRRLDPEQQAAWDERYLTMLLCVAASAHAYGGDLAMLGVAGAGTVDLSGIPLVLELIKNTTRAQFVEATLCWLLNKNKLDLAADEDIRMLKIMQLLEHTTETGGILSNSLRMTERHAIASGPEAAATHRKHLTQICRDYAISVRKQAANGHLGAVLRQCCAAQGNKSTRQQHGSARHDVPFVREAARSTAAESIRHANQETLAKRIELGELRCAALHAELAEWELSMSQWRTQVQNLQRQEPSTPDKRRENSSSSSSSSSDDSSDHSESPLVMEVECSD